MVYGGEQTAVTVSDKRCMREWEKHRNAPNSILSAALRLSMLMSRWRRLALIPRGILNTHRHTDTYTYRQADKEMDIKTETELSREDSTDMLHGKSVSVTNEVAQKTATVQASNVGFIYIYYSFHWSIRLHVFNQWHHVMNYSSELNNGETVTDWLLSCVTDSRRLKVSIAFIELFQLLRSLSLERSSSCQALIDNGTNTPEVSLSIIAQWHQHFRRLQTDRHTHIQTYYTHWHIAAVIQIYSTVTNHYVN